MPIQRLPSVPAMRWLAGVHAKPYRADRAAASDSSQKSPSPPAGVARYPWKLPCASRARPIISPRELIEQAVNRYKSVLPVTNEFKSTGLPPSDRMNARGDAVGAAKRDPAGKDTPPTSPRSLIASPMLDTSPEIVPTSWMSISGLQKKA